MFNAYFTDTVVHITKTGSASWGEKSEVETNVKCRIDYGMRLVRNYAGEQVVSSAKVQMHDRTITPGDKFRVDGTEHEVLGFSKQRAFSKHTLLEVYLG